jgi:hypothetical protein
MENKTSFQGLKQFEPRLFERYQTLERDVKSGSNSFFDALGDLIDNYLKVVAVRVNIELDPIFSSGKILKEEAFHEFLFVQVGINEVDYKALRNLVRIINEHKHAAEKDVTVGKILLSLKNFFSVYSAISNHFDIQVEAFDEEYYRRLYRQNERESQKYLVQLKKLQKELADEKSLTTEQVTVIEKAKSLDGKREIISDDYISELQNVLSAVKDIRIEVLNEKLEQALSMLLELRSLVNETRAMSLNNGMLIAEIRQ